MKLNKLFLALGSLALSISLVGCSSAAPSSSEAGVVKEMKGEDLAKIQDDKKDKEKHLVIDVRSAEEYKAGHLMHAINIPVGEVKNNLEKLSAWKDKSVILYCNTGKKSKEAADILAKEGFKDVTNAQGVKDYTDYKLVIYGNITGADFQKVITEAKGAFFDARDAKDFEAGHVKDAKNVDAKNLDGIESLLPEDKNAPIYTYCYSGNRSGEVAKKITELGYTNVTNVLDGTKEFEYKF